MASNKKRKKPRLLSHTRPTSAARKPSLSSQATRSLIRKHHTLQKQLHTALANNDATKAKDLRNQLAASGGLAKYQEASIQGQAAERGGDTSKVLIEWLSEVLPRPVPKNLGGREKLRMLEVGALKVDNACSRSGIFDMTRIDLHSQHPGIKTQDLMEMPLPSEDRLRTEGFDIVSLSLVVNFVGDATGRGEMLKRVGGFLRSDLGDDVVSPALSSALPALFLVLPAPCVMNSRYLDEERMGKIMNALGYVQVRTKLSNKLVYHLWRFVSVSTSPAASAVFNKQEVRPGGQRNNFTIVLR